MAGALLLMVLVAVVVAGVREALARAGEERASVGLASSLAVLAVLPELCGRPLHSVVGGALVVAALAAPAAFLYARRRLRGPLFTTGGDPAAWLLGGLVFAGGLWCAWTTYLWDEDSTHFGVGSLIARGLLPPSQPYFPGAPFRYHIGYDVLVGTLHAFSGWRIDACCDVVTSVCLAALLWILADAGRALAGRAGAAFAVFVGLLGYGPGAMCLAGGWAIPDMVCADWFPASWNGATTMPPAVISNFFQHPQGLGMPISLAALLVATGAGVTTRRVLAAAVVTALLAQAQTVYFGLTGLALGAAVVVDAARSPRPFGRAVGVLALRLALLAAAGAAGFMLGGVLRGGGALDAITVGRGYFHDPAGALLLHNLSLFGPTLLAVPVALVVLVVALVRGGKSASAAPLLAALVVAGAAGFIVANVASYARSWDIVKFFAAGAFFANILLAWLLAASWGLAGPRTGARALARGLAVVVALVSTSSASVWLLRHGALNGVIAPAYREFPPDAIGTVLDDAHGREIGRDERFLTSHEDIAQLGFLVAGRDWRKNPSYLLDRARADRLHAARRRVFPRLTEADLDVLGVSLVFVTEREARALPALDDAARFTRVPGDVVVRGAHWRLYRRAKVRP